MRVEDPSFLDGYLVAADRWTRPVGAVRRDGGEWRLIMFGLPADRQPTEAYPTRAEAGRRVIDLAGPAAALHGEPSP